MTGKRATMAGASAEMSGIRAGGDAERVHRVDAGARAVAEQRHRPGRQLALGGELRGERRELGGGREVPVPQQPRRLLEVARAARSPTG